MMKKLKSICPNCGQGFTLVYRAGKYGEIVEHLLIGKTEVKEVKEHGKGKSEGNIEKSSREQKTSKGETLHEEEVSL